MTVRGEDYVAVLDATTYAEKARITVPNGPGMTIFSPDGALRYVCSSFTPETVVVEHATARDLGRVKQVSPFCPNIAVVARRRAGLDDPEGRRQEMVFRAKPPFQVLRVLDTGPITNHVNFVRTAARAVRLRDDRRAEPGEGLSHQRFRAGRDHPGRRSAARHLAFRATARASMWASRTATQ